MTQRRFRQVGVSPHRQNCRVASNGCSHAQRKHPPHAGRLRRPPRSLGGSDNQKQTDQSANSRHELRRTPLLGPPEPLTCGEAVDRSPLLPCTMIFEFPLLV